MERLTTKGRFPMCANFENLECKRIDTDCSQCSTAKKVWDKLAAYENTGLTPEEVKSINDFSKSQCAILLAENNQLKAERNAVIEYVEQLQSENSELRARLNNAVELPCKIGDTVYDDEITPFKICMIELYGHKNVSFQGNYYEEDELIDEIDFDLDDVGKTVFLTREEAEKALKERENDGTS